MIKQIQVEAPLSRAEKIKVSVAALALGGMAVGGGAAVVHELKKPDTHEEIVRVEFGDETPTIYDGALQLRHRGANESVDRLESELKAAEPGADGVVHDGDVATVHIDVPNK